MADNEFIKTLENKMQSVCNLNKNGLKQSWSELKINNDKDLDALLKIKDMEFVPTSIFAEGYKIKDVDLAKKFLELNFGCIKNNKDHLIEFRIKNYFKFIDGKIKMKLASILTEE